MARPKKKPPIEGNPTHQQAPSVAEISTNLFNRLRENQDDSRNSHLTAMMHIVWFLNNNYQRQTFSFQDVVTASRTYDLPVEEIRPIFDLWIQELLKFKRVEELKLVYEWQQFKFI